MKPRANSGLTWIELLVALAILGVFAALVLPAVTAPMVCGGISQTLSNMKQLHLATYQMALDRFTTGDAAIGGWPGDTGGTFSNWEKQLVPAYLSSNDFSKLLSAPGKRVPSGRLSQSLSECAVLVYAVSSNSASNAVFLSTANFTNTPTGGSPLEPLALPYGNKGFAVMRAGGDGAILLPKQVAQTNAIGSYVPLLR